MNFQKIIKYLLISIFFTTGCNGKPDRSQDKNKTKDLTQKKNQVIQKEPKNSVAQTPKNLGPKIAKASQNVLTTIKPIYASDDLAVRLKVNTFQSAPDSTLKIKLFVNTTKKKQRHAKLLQGNFIFTFVPVYSGVPTFATHHHFSGGGGIDYTGKKPIEYNIKTPTVPGKYRLFATVLAAPEDIRAFLMTARMKAGAGPWWGGAMSTATVAIEISKS